MRVATGSVLAERLFHRTLDGVADLFAVDGQGDETVAGRAGPGNVYRDVSRIRLPRPDAANLGPPGLGVRRVAALLGYGYGLAALELGPSSAWPYHRTVASARCLYPTEVYPYLTPGLGRGTAPDVAEPAQAESGVDGDAVPAGLYHYDPLHHGLARLRGPEAGPGMAALLGRVLSGPALIVTSVFWRTAYRYRTYAYRLCSQEAGLVVGSLVAVAEALGLRAAVCYRFVDAAAARLLGLAPGQESPFAVVTLAPATAADALPAVAPPDVGAGADNLRALAPRVDGLGVPQPERYADLLAVDRDSARADADVDPVEIVADHARTVAARPSATAGSARRAPRERPSHGDAHPLRDLARWVLARESGEPNLLPALDPLDAGELAGVLAALDRPYRTDLRSPGLVPPVRVHVVANRVDGLAPGVYRWRGAGDLSLVEAGPMGARLHAITNSFNLNYRLAPAVVYVSVDTGRYLDALGSRAYRVCHLETGVLVQWLSVAAAARGWIARVSNGYDVSAVRDLLRLDDPAVSPLFQVLLARRRTGARCRVDVM